MSSSEISYFRKTIIDKIIPHAQKDPRIMILVCDMGFGVCDNFARLLPDRIINIGIMEQGTIGIAAGMAFSGMKPIVYSIVNFLAFRALEQVRNDLVIQKANVKLIGTGANDYFQFLGKSHCCGQDDVAVMKLIGMPVFDPYTQSSPEGFDPFVSSWISSDVPAYIRV